MKYKWCKHIKYYSYRVDGNLRYGWYIGKIDDIPKNWKFCPICGALRPTKRILITVKKDKDSKKIHIGTPKQIIPGTGEYFEIGGLNDYAYGT
jgi:hypothetical protein